jgi:hypothetical protein
MESTAWQIWRDLFTKWPTGIPRRGVVMSTPNEVTPFKGFLLKGDMLLLERTNPDPLGTRYVLMSYEAIHMVKLIDPLTEAVLNTAGFTGQLSKL